MASGKMKQARLEAWQLICLAFGEGLDVERFLKSGVLTESCVGKPLELSPEQEAAVQVEVDRIRRENPNLPKMPTVS